MQLKRKRDSLCFIYLCIYSDKYGENNTCEVFQFARVGNSFGRLKMVESLAEALDSFVSFPTSNAGYKVGSDYSNNSVLAGVPAVETR